jgi:hypothetical protein
MWLSVSKTLLRVNVDRIPREKIEANRRRDDSLSRNQEQEQQAGAGKNLAADCTNKRRSERSELDLCS